jgi:hypothetical protein
VGRHDAFVEPFLEDGEAELVLIVLLLGNVLSQIPVLGWRDEYVSWDGTHHLYWTVGSTAGSLPNLAW